MPSSSAPGLSSPSLHDALPILPLQMGFMRRFDPGYVRAKELIESGELGRVEQFRAYSRDTYMPSLKFIRDSGGSFLDMAVHDFDRSEEHTSELQSRFDLVCRLLQLPASPVLPYTTLFRSCRSRWGSCAGSTPATFARRS